EEVASPAGDHDAPSERCDRVTQHATAGKAIPAIIELVTRGSVDVRLAHFDQLNAVCDARDVDNCGVPEILFQESLDHAWVEACDAHAWPIDVGDRPIG